jgi:hypothetical protein
LRTVFAWVAEIRDLVQQIVSIRYIPLDAA